MAKWHSGPPPSVGVDCLRDTFSYNPATGVLLSKSTGKPAGYKDTNGYIKVMIKKSSFYAHRIAWAMTHGEWPTQIDHINGVRDDNRLENLRNVTPIENNQNVVRSAGCITYDKRFDTYYATCTIFGARHYVGGFKSREDAEMAVADFRAKNGSIHRHSKLAPNGWEPKTKVKKASLVDTANKLREHIDAPTAAEMFRLSGVSKSAYQRAVSQGLVQKHQRKRGEEHRPASWPARSRT